MLPIRGVYTGSDFFPSPILDPGSASKNLSILTPKNCFLSSQNYDPRCSSRIRILILYPSRIPDPGDKKAPDPDPQHWMGASNKLAIARCIGMTGAPACRSRRGPPGTRDPHSPAQYPPQLLLAI